MGRSTMKKKMSLATLCLVVALGGCGDKPDQHAEERGKEYSDKRLKEELDGMKDAKRGFRPIPADAFKTNSATEKTAVKP